MRVEEGRLLLFMSGLMVVMGIASKVLFRWIEIPYGRYTSPYFGFPVPARFAWFLQELPSLCLPIILFFCAPRSLQLPQIILLSAFIAHYAQRTLIFSFLIRGGKPTPFISFASALLFCIYNGYLQGRYLCNIAEYSPDWISEPVFVIGLSLWLIGLLINVHSDHLLRNIRQPGETGYRIPRGGLFEYVSGANFFGETVEWLGFAFASCSIESAAFAIFSYLILSSRAEHHHRWYLEKFEDYPKSRKILIPFLY